MQPLATGHRPQATDGCQFPRAALRANDETANKQRPCSYTPRRGGALPIACSFSIHSRYPAPSAKGLMITVPDPHDNGKPAAVPFHVHINCWPHGPVVLSLKHCPSRPLDTPPARSTAWMTLGNRKC